ncbi:MAG: photosynthetic reaction center cytochrome c subunit family protein [Fimbriimonadaceae bacterium]
MRFTHCFAALSCAVFASALAIPRQDQPLAEKQFKNIQSFKGSKASDIIPAMQFMSASLGVDCDYCHVEDRASDEKEAKKTAREMIALQRDINERNFHGRNRVTCASCHAGHTHPNSVPPISGGQIRARRSPNVNATDVLAAYGKAVGGDPSHPITELKLEGTNVSHGVTGKVEAVYAGAKFTYATRLAKSEQKMGFNGNVAWFTTPTGVQQVPLSYAIKYVRQNTLFTGPDSLPKLTGIIGATANLGDRAVLVISGTIADDRTRVTLYFDKATGLLTRTLFGYPTVLGTMVQSNDYADYRNVGGVKVPMTITNHASEGDTVTRYTSATVESNIAPSQFDPAK